jgi:L-lactate dehydrogenase complex protein LldG
MNERDAILARIREALSVPARTAHGLPGNKPGTAIDRVLPAVPTTPEEQWTRFETEARDLRAETACFGSVAEMQTALRSLQAAEGWARVASHRGCLTESAVAGLGLPVVWVDDAPAPAVLETCDVGITECDGLVAQTGSVVLTSRSAGGRALSVLPPHHVVLARREQLVGGLPEALARLERTYGGHYPSMISFVTGPSRTGDIERILVLGAHGPKRLTVFCC